MAAGNVVFEGSNARVVESALTAVADAVVVPNLSLDHPHSFFSVQFFDANGNSVAATGGTVAFAVLVANSKAFEAPPNSTVSADTPETVSVDANIRAVRATPNAILTATQYKLVVSQNRT